MGKIASTKSNADRNVLYGDFSTPAVTLVRGEGVYVFDDRGTRYLDAVGGVGVVNIGHGVPEIIDVLTTQAKRLAFSYGGNSDNEPRRALASRLHDWSPASMGETRTLFCSGGAEANEAALKLAYQYQWERGKSTKRKFIGRWQSYHGNTLATLSVGGRTAWRRMHSALLFDSNHVRPPYCYRCPWGQIPSTCALQCAQELRAIILQEGPENIAAFIAEPIIGTSMSAVVPPVGYYRAVREICDEFDILFIADEVMSGVGRTGTKWGIDHWAVAPDIITAAKGLSGGYAPLAATILSEKVWKATADGSRAVMHSYTFGGNPLSCAVGCAVLDYIKSHELVDRAARMGEFLFAELRRKIGNLAWVGDIRGKGLFAGVEIVADRSTKRPFPPGERVTQRVKDAALRRGIFILEGAPGLIDGQGGDHFELLPPYTVDESQVTIIAQTVHDSLVEVLSEAH